MSLLKCCFGGPPPEAVREPKVAHDAALQPATPPSGSSRDARPRGDGPKPSFERRAPQQPSALEQRAGAACSSLASISGPGSRWQRVTLLLETCRRALEASDARIAFFDSTAGHTFVFSASASLTGVPRVAGWGQPQLYRLLSDQPQSTVVLRDYHTALLAVPPEGPPSPQAGQQQLQQQPLSPHVGVRASPAAMPPPPAAPALQRASAPDPFSLACRPDDLPITLQPPNLLALPVMASGGGGARLAAALLLGWDAPAAAAAAQRPPAAAGDADGGARPVRKEAAAAAADSSAGGGGLTLTVADVAALRRLAAFLGFGLTCDPHQARLLEELARRFAHLPTANCLHELVVGLLDGVAEMLALRFSLRLQPVLIFTHGPTTTGPAALFSRRAAGAASSNTTGAGGGGGGSAVLQHLASSMSLRMDGDGEGEGREEGGSGNVSAAAAAGSRIRAVRIALHHTLLAEALRAAAKPAAAIASSSPPAPQLKSPLATGHGSRPASGVQQKGSDQMVMVVDASSGHQPLPTGASTAAVTVHLMQQLQQQPLHTTVVTNTSAHMLEEGAPCRDLLLITNLAGGAIGSLVLCVEPPPQAACTAASLPAATTAETDVHVQQQHHHHPLQRPPSPPPPAAAAPGGGGGRGATGTGTATPPGAVTPQSLAALYMQRQFGLYLLANEQLPVAVLADIAAEAAALLGMALSACRTGCLSYNGGRCAVELYSLQEQLLGGQATAGGTLSIASAVAAAMGASGVWARPFGPNSSAAAPAASAAAGSLTPGTPGGGGGAAAASGSLASGPGAALHRSYGNLRVPMRAGSMLSAAAHGQVAAAGNIHSAGFARFALNSNGTGAAAVVGSPGDASGLAVGGGGGGGGGGAAATTGLNRLHAPLRGLLLGGTGDVAGPAVGGRTRTAGGTVDLLATAPDGLGAGATADLPLWLPGSNQEVQLEPPAVGPSPLEVMVTSMRHGLTAALSSAMLPEATDESKTALAQELAAIRLYDVIGRGGQGVVFHGTLHGLETAVKVIVHRGKGEPLAHDGENADAEDDGGGGGGGGGDGGDGGDGDGGDGDGGALSRIRKAKRGALELVVTTTLSHPNIVQVLASFSDVIMVRCTYRSEPTPRLRLVAKDDPVLAGWAAPGPLNTVVCLEFCDSGTLLEAAHTGAFRPAGASVLTGAVRPALVALYMSLLEVALALRYLHSRRLVHCDIKPQNVLLKSSTRDPRGWTCKLSDFGCVRLVTELPATHEEQQRALRAAAAASNAGGGGGGSQQQARGATQRQGSGGVSTPQAPSPQPQPPATVIGFRVAQPLGTVAYMAPECFIKGQTLTAAIDVYAFGILMFEVLMCRPPYSGVDAQALPRMVMRQHLRPEFHPLAPPEYCNLAFRCWSGHPSRRPTAAQLVFEIETLLANAQATEGRTAVPSPQPHAPPQPPPALPEAAALPQQSPQHAPLLSPPLFAPPPLQPQPQQVQPLQQHRTPSRMSLQITPQQAQQAQQQQFATLSTPSASPTAPPPPALQLQPPPLQQQQPQQHRLRQPSFPVPSSGDEDADATLALGRRGGGASPGRSGGVLGIAGLEGDLPLHVVQMPAPPPPPPR